MAILKSITQGTFLENELMKHHTSYGIGGPAKAYVIPKNKKDLAEIMTTASRYHIPVFFVGSGSNLLVSDTGIDGLVISPQKSLTHFYVHHQQVYAESGVMLGKFVKECMKHQLTGMESLIGVPGTLGGALIMNAGAFGGEISTHLKSVEVLTLSGEQKQYGPGDISFGYRHSSFPKDEFITGAMFEFPMGDKKTIQSKKETASRGRKTHQPLKYRSAGSVFKNPKEGEAAGYLIDKAGLKGTKFGDAEISLKHANFFVNHGQATAADIADLIRLAKKAVYDKFNVLLELEIKTLGFEPGAFDL